MMSWACLTPDCVACLAFPHSAANTIAPDSTVILASQTLTIHGGIHHSAVLDTAEWGATVSALRGLRQFRLGLLDEEMLPALSALTGLTSLRLGIRHVLDSSLVCVGVSGCICSAVQNLSQVCCLRAALAEAGVSVLHVGCIVG